MDYIEHPSTNHHFGAPPGWDQGEMPCGVLPVTLAWIGEQQVIHSFWRPNDIELTKLLQGKPIVLTVFGTEHPVVSVGVAV